MLQITCHMNSSVEAIFACKCCSLCDQNLEVLIRNTGPGPVTVAAFLLLENETGRLKVDTLYPPRDQTLPPGEVAAYYTYMDEAVWDRFLRVIVTDRQGREYRFNK